MTRRNSPATGGGVKSLFPIPCVRAGVRAVTVTCVLTGLKKAPGRHRHPACTRMACTCLYRP